jgi:hypothetical protein
MLSSSSEDKDRCLPSGNGRVSTSKRLTKHRGCSMSVSDMPTNARKMLMRWRGTKRTTTKLPLIFRSEASRRRPHARACKEDFSIGPLSRRTTTVGILSPPSREAYSSGTENERNDER